MTTRGEHAVYWRNTDVGEVDLLKAKFVTHTYAPHSHETFAVGVILAGAERFRYRHADHLAPARSVVLINPGEMHTGEAGDSGGWSYRMLYPSVELLQSAMASPLGHAASIPYFPHPVVDDPALAQTLARLHMTLETEPDALTRASRLLLAFAALIERHADLRPSWPVRLPGDPALREVEDYLRAHLAEPVTLAELAQVAGMSPYQLIRRFARATGVPPHAYLTHLRIQEARHLLARGLPVVEVAAAAGFYDQAHLTRHFKRIVGVPPGQFAQKVR